MTARLQFDLPLLVASALLLVHPAHSAAKGGPDLDSDGVEDAADNCPANPNGMQEDTDADGRGDVCDRDTINPVLGASLKGRGPDAWHASTPFQRSRLASDGSLRFSAEGGMFSTANAAIGFAGADDSAVLILSATGISGVSGSYSRTSSPTIRQSTWQSATAVNLFAGRRLPNLPMFFATGANGSGLAFEVPLSQVPSGQDLAISLQLTLPAGHCLDTSELLAGNGVGRIAIEDCASGVAKVSIGAATVGAFGHEVVLEDDENFFGLGRIADELKNDPASPDDVGTNFYGGIESALVKTRYVFKENQADGDFALTQVSGQGSAYTLKLVAPAAFLDRNRGSSQGVLLSLGLTSLTEVDFGVDQTVSCRHMVGFDQAKVTGTDTTLRCENVIGTFDQNPVDYSLFPNKGGTAANEDAASQQQTGIGFAGSVVELHGNTLIDFAGGGAGVGITPGARVGPAGCEDPSQEIDWAAATGSCAPGFNLRGSLTADNLTIHGSFSGLTCSDSDCRIGTFEFLQARDPNATSEGALHGAGGIGCSAARGAGFGVNPSNGAIVGPAFDLGPCTIASVGEGSCIPTPHSLPPGTGICNLIVDRVELIGLGSVLNPNLDRTIPSGPGISFAARNGRGQIGSKAFNAATGRCEAAPGVEDPAPSKVLGFQAGAGFSGGANTTDLGVPMAADDPNAVPPIAYCVDNIVFGELETGISAGSNVRLEMSRCSVRDTAYGALTVLAGAANIATPANSSCPVLDGACRTPVQEFACPGCKRGGPHFLAVAGGGLSAPTEIHLKQCEVGLDELGNTVSAQSPTLQAMPLQKGLDLVVAATAIGDGAGGQLTNPVTTGGVPAALLKATVQIGRGADTLVDPDLLKIVIEDSNLGVVEEPSGRLAVGLGNRDAPGASQSNSALKDNCYAAGSSGCAGLDVVGASDSDDEAGQLDAAADALAAALPNPAGEGLKSPFKCYAPDNGQPLESMPVVTTSDAIFGYLGLESTLVRTLNVCAPASQDGAPVSDVFAHMHCYEISEAATPDVDVRVQSSFGGAAVMGVRAQALCLPAVLEGGDIGQATSVLGAFKCYQRSVAEIDDEEVVHFVDGFEDKDSRVKLDPFWICNPVALGGAPAPVDPEDQIACYRVSDAQGEPAFPGALVAIEDAVRGVDEVLLARSEFACARASIEVVQVP